MKRKKIRIINKYRFMTSLSIILILSFTFILSIDAAINRVEGYQESDFVEIYVDYGDTIWNLAKEHSNNNKDIRDSIYEISQLNNLDTYDIYPGQIIRIPIE